MNNSSDQGDNIDEDIASISRVYQALDKSNPSPSLDHRILRMAQQQINQKAKTPSKPVSLPWWKNQHYHGAAAASFLVVCLVYILPSRNSDIQSVNPSIAEMSQSQPLPIELSERAFGLTQEKAARKKSEQQARQAKQRIVFVSSEALDPLEPASLGLSRSTKLSEDKIASNFNAGSALPELSADMVASSVFDSKEKQANDLIAQNKVIIKELMKLQLKLNMSHQQIINEAIKAKPTQNTQSDSNMPALIYLKQQNLMKQNLEQILKSDSSIDVAKVYKAVLSSQEIATFIKIASEKSEPE